MRILIVAAHPDDENTRLIAYLAIERLCWLVKHVPLEYSHRTYEDTSMVGTQDRTEHILKCRIVQQVVPSQLKARGGDHVASDA